MHAFDRVAIPPAVSRARPADAHISGGHPPFAPSRNVTVSPSKGAPQAVVAAILFREILKPLAHGLGPVGEIALGAVADDLFVRKPR